MTNLLKRSVLTLCLLGLSGAVTPVDARRGPAKHSIEERMEIFSDVFSAIEQGQQALAADHLLQIIDNPRHDYYHVDAYAQLGGILEKMTMPYSALLAYEKGLNLDASRIPSIAEKSITLADELGDSEVLESIFASNLQIEVSNETRSRMAYLAARSAFSKGDLGPALGILMMVQPTDPDFPEAQNLQGVIYSQQDRPDSALAPFQIAYQKGLDAEKASKFQDAVLMNMARSYFGAKNYPQASVYYAQVPRSSIYWLDAQFERGWSHFHMQDMNGVLGILHTLNTPFFQDEGYAEAELLRIYGMVMLCKFNEANKGIDAFAPRFSSQQETLAELSTYSPADLFNMVRDEISNKPTKLPNTVSRRYIEEDRIIDAIKSVTSAENEAQRLTSVSGSNFSETITTWVQDRKESIIQQEGQRIKEDLQNQAESLQRQMISLEISKLDILDMETQMLNRAAQTGKMEDAKRQVRRNKRIRSGELVWEYDGEMWADEVGYYRVNTKSECPASMME